LSKNEIEKSKRGTCIEAGCPNKATRKIKTPDGQKIHLCEEHYRKWGREEGKSPHKGRLAAFRNFFRRKK